MIVIDAGPIIGAASPNDQRHAECVALLRDLGQTVPLMTVPGITAVCYFLATRGSAQGEASFIRSLGAMFEVVDLTATDWERTAELVETYGDLPLGMADASVVAVAERYGVTEIVTLDDRHFRVVRPRHVDAFTLRP